MVFKTSAGKLRRKPSGRRMEAIGPKSLNMPKQRRLERYPCCFKAFHHLARNQSAGREGTTANWFHLWQCNDSINGAKLIPAFPNGPFRLNIPLASSRRQRANAPPIRADGSSNWTTIKTAVSRAVGELTKITAEIGSVLSERSELESSPLHKYTLAEAPGLTLGRCSPRWEHVYRKEKKKSMYLTFGEAILHRHNKGPATVAATVQWVEQLQAVSGARNEGTSRLARLYGASLRKKGRAARAPGGSSWRRRSWWVGGGECGHVFPARAKTQTRVKECVHTMGNA